MGLRCRDPSPQEKVLEDRELVQRLLAKDDEAYRLFYRTYQGRIYRAASYLLGYQDPDAEDITQEVFLAALQQLHKFEFRSSLYHWLNHICMYLCFDRIRKRKRMVASLQEELEAMTPAKLGPGQDPDPEEKERLLTLVESQRELLGAPCRGLLDLRDEQGKSYAQIAGILKVPMGTVMSRLARCKETLKELVLKSLKGGPYGR